MNFNKELYETSEAKEYGEFETLTLGGHEVVIKDAREYESDLTGNISLKVCVDIAGNDPQVGYFQKQYDEIKKNAKEGEVVKWSTGATRYLSLKDENIAYLKGFITSLEKSNNNFKFNKDGNWAQLNGLKCAGVFGLEEYQKIDGNIATATKLTNFRSLEKLPEIKIPRVKLLDGTYVDYESYKPTSNKNEDNYIEIKGEDLPF